MCLIWPTAIRDCSSVDENHSVSEEVARTWAGLETHSRILARWARRLEVLNISTFQTSLYGGSDKGDFYSHPPL